MFKPLTKDGEAFIRTVLLSGNTFSGSLPFPLGRSLDSSNTIYSAHPKYQGVEIVDSITYGNALIFWFNQYSGNHSLDANIIAAQVFIESGYKLWEYSNSGDVKKTSGMGIAQMYDNEIWDIFFTNTKEEVPLQIDQSIYDDQKNIIGLNLSGDLNDIRSIIPYLDNATAETNAIALANRSQLFQNIMNNPEIIIRELCRFMSEIGERNNNLAAASLFAYYVNPYLTSNTYNEVINNAANSNLAVKPAMDYVEKIFKVLGGKYKAKYKGFGKDYVYDLTLNDQANKNLSSTIVINQGSQTPPVGYNGVYPVDTVKTVVRALEKYGIMNKYLQSGVLAVISTEGSFFPKSELSYSKTSNDRLRLIFGIKLADLTETQLTALKANDVNFFAKVYEGKYGAQYGNTVFGDGFSYRGRGMNQVTFKNTYKTIGDTIGVNLLANPDLLNNVKNASEAVAVFFRNSFNQATTLGLQSKYYGLNSFNDVNDIALGVKVALHANAGWSKNLATSIYPEEYKKQMGNVGKLYDITISV